MYVHSAPTYHVHFDAFQLTSAASRVHKLYDAYRTHNYKTTRTTEHNAAAE